MIKFAHAQLWVHDQDEALAFYTDKLGMEVRADVTVAEMGDFRWLVVAPPGQSETAIVLMAIPDPPMFEQETAEQVRSLMAKGCAGTALSHHRGLPSLLRGAQGPRRRVHRGARGAPVRNRLRLSRPERQRDQADRAAGAAERLRARRRRFGHRSGMA